MPASRSIATPISRTPGNAPSFATRSFTDCAPNSSSTIDAIASAKRSSSAWLFVRANARILATTAA